MQRLFQHIVHVICMICKVSVALNQTFVHGKQSGIVKWNAGFIV
jgi:VanZ family protein